MEPSRTYLDFNLLVDEYAVTLGRNETIYISHMNEIRAAIKIFPTNKDMRSSDSHLIIAFSEQRSRKNIIFVDVDSNILNTQILVDLDKFLTTLLLLETEYNTKNMEEDTLYVLKSNALNLRNDQSLYMTRLTMANAEYREPYIQDAYEAGHTIVHLTVGPSVATIDDPIFRKLTISKKDLLVNLPVL